jgi:hypothetical protein
LDKFGHKEKIIISGTFYVPNLLPGYVKEGKTQTI